MKKFIFKLLSISIIILISFNAYAKEISLSEAQSIASNFIKNHSKSINCLSSKISLKLVHTAKSSILGKNCYYIFNNDINGGFIIVSADDCTQNEVLGFCESGEFNQTEMPINFKWWLGQYQREIDFAIKNSIQSTPIIRSYATSVAPLLGGIEWDQGDPYNLLCPSLTNSSGNTEKTVTGCVATATAQVMRYYKWPEKGTGTKNYIWSNGGKTLSVNFANSTYDWDNMTETYNSNSTTIEKNAVAKLMYDCGISCNMNYGLSETGGSGASALNQVIGLYNYFSYDNGMRFLSRNYYKLADWEVLIKNEIDNKRPVLYYGTGSGGGHAFIIDGYNQNGYFHFNWGWSGNSNGYFLTTALNPRELGIGGGAGGYNYEQGITIGVQPKQSSSNASVEITSDGLQISGDATNGFQITATRIMNSNWQSTTFSAAFIIESISNSESQLLTFLSNKNLNSSYYFSPITYNANTLASYFNDGTYKISLMIQPSGSNTWHEAPTLLSAAKYIYMTVKNGKATNVTYGQTSIPQLSIAGYELNDKIYANRVATVKAKVKNSGSEYWGDMAIIFADNSGNILATSGLVMANIAQDKTEDVIFEYSMISLASGVSITQETPCVMYLFANASDKSNYQVGKLGEATLYPTGSGSPALAFTKTPIVNSSTEDNVSITLGLINNGSIFKDAITFHTWDYDLNYEYCGGILQYAMLEKQESKEITFSFPYDGVIGHTYLVNIYANNTIIKGNTSSINYVCSFILNKGEDTGIENIKANLELVIANSNNNLSITAPTDIKNIKVYTTGGLLIANEEFDATSNEATISLMYQLPGIYIIKVETTDGIKTSKIIVK